ncbi:hypothetical protein [Kribbella sp. NPDC051770]|uniref:hypothetical protein n=1 Tax=Kribbella sp. NPDC051770 TaxID=3155413 RepID=UPI00342A73E1
MTRRKLVDGVLVVVVLVAIVGLYRVTPDDTDFQQPVAVKGVTGQAVHTPRFDVTVEKVRTSKKLRVPRTTPDRDTLTDFVVIDAVVTANREPIHLQKIGIRAADGTTYAAANRSGLERIDLLHFQLAPGIPVRGPIVVEMPADQLPGATLLVLEQQIFNDLQPQATIALKIDEDQLPALHEDVAILNPAVER